MSKCIMLDNSMFDDGSIECKNFTLVVGAEYDIIQCEWDYILKHYTVLVHKDIREAISKGQRHIVYDNGNPHGYCAISWD